MHVCLVFALSLTHTHINTHSLTATSALLDLELPLLLPLDLDLDRSDMSVDPMLCLAGFIRPLCRGQGKMEYATCVWPNS